MEAVGLKQLEFLKQVLFFKKWKTLLKYSYYISIKLFKTDNL